MKYLKIKNGKVYFLNRENIEVEIDKINKDDILNLLNLVISDDIEFEMDEFDENEIMNEAHKIIYKNIYEKFKYLMDNKNYFIDQISNLYKVEINNYNLDI